MNLRAACLAAACFALPATAAFAADADPVVKAQLESKGTPFTIDEDGDFQITVRISDERTQLVWVRSAVEQTDQMRVREIWSPGYQSEGAAFPAAIANDLLERSNMLKLGSWVKQDQVAMLVTKIPADASASQLDEAIDLTASAADEVELDLTGKDDL
ncbi:hypothetical protein [Arenimonas daejeonensis]|uniref:hypothetical protein n=1 Tax=Arenimonas daejeonensis TaxID=370777 RepID=UPI0011BDEA70|nr:hypothetical protein [Arenimonas daejeonensis]